jgi:hypothetical protein
MPQDQSCGTGTKNQQRLGKPSCLDQEQKDDQADDCGWDVEDGAPSQYIGGARDGARSCGGHSGDERLHLRVLRPAPKMRRQEDDSGGGHRPLLNARPAALLPAPGRPRVPCWRTSIATSGGPTGDDQSWMSPRRISARSSAPTRRPSLSTTATSLCGAFIIGAIASRKSWSSRAVATSVSIRSAAFFARA